jgi:hypothetical protein
MQYPNNTYLALLFIDGVLTFQQIHPEDINCKRSYTINRGCENQRKMNAT